MSKQSTAFYRGTKSVNFDFSAENISSDGGVLLLEQLERKHKLIRYFSSLIPDARNPLLKFRRRLQAAMANFQANKR